MHHIIGGNMKNLFYLSIFSLLFAGCASFDNGELQGVQGREEWFEPDPYGMLFIPMGSYNMGPSDQDVRYALTAHTKTVSVQAFWMDRNRNYQ
jgi:formylglycine-generating enzyme